MLRKDMLKSIRMFTLLPTIGVLILLTLSVSSKVFANGITVRVSVSSTGEQGNFKCESRPSISSNGRYIAFMSKAYNLVNGDTNNDADIFGHDRLTAQTTRVSVSSSGVQGNGGSNNGSISCDGRYVAFGSSASNLVNGDNNDQSDIFVHDQQTAQTILVSVSSSGVQANNGSTSPSISSDGRYVAFTSFASNLVAGDTNNTLDIFVHDQQTGQTKRVNVSSSGEQGGYSLSPSISSDGRYVAFETTSDNLVDGDNNGKFDIFVHDLQTAQTTRVSVSSAGAEGNDNSFQPSMSSDGRYVAFQSNSDNLVDGANTKGNIFVHDRLTAQTMLVSVSSSGEQGNYGSIHASISSDGQHVAFLSFAENLVDGDTNNYVDVFVHDRPLDSDGDGVINELDEFPNNSNEWLDSDGDGMGDNFENEYGLNNSVNDALQDSDSDGFSNI